MAYLELEAYSEPRYIQNPSNIYDGTFCKNSYLALFPASALKIFS